MKTLLAISLLLLCSTAWACDSFDDCMKESNKQGMITWQNSYSQRAMAYAIEDLAKAIESK